MLAVVAWVEMGNPSPMDIDDLIRQRIKAAMRAKPMSQAEVCRATRGAVKKQAFSAFLKGGPDGSFSMSWDKYAAVERALGVRIMPDSDELPGPVAPSDPAQLESSAGSAVQLEVPVGFIPVIDVRRLDLLLEDPDMLGKIKRIAHAKIAAPVSDPDAFAIEIRVPHQRFDVGDRLVVSPATRPLTGNWTAVQVGRRMLVAEYLEVDGKPVARASAGEFHKDFRVIGTAVGRYQSLI